LFTNKAQLQQLAAMAGVPLSQGHVSRLVSFCHGITPKGIWKCVKTTKCVWYGILLMRKMLPDTQQVSAFSHPVGADCLDQEFSAMTNSHQQKGSTASHEAST
jgi:hypothetical protein